MKTLLCLAASVAFALAACGSPEGNAAENAASPVKAGTPNAGNAGSPVKAEAKTAQTERRCGWLHNPTPGNWWLADRDGQWILGTQGGDQTPGMDEMPDMTTAGWNQTNGHYGHGCACMSLTVDSATLRVTRIADAEPRPLAQCSADRALPKP
ncbi:DUF4087 domain-containing protein [Allosphingosinicella sp.]|jgi:hypothetical protein|uniref:DUF4087 domain-containing protein n=1 Tax=Allosphingosinicella sp. TaxID=2823234 RepID=UPI002EE9F378